MTISYRARCGVRTGTLATYDSTDLTLAEIVLQGGDVRDDVTLALGMRMDASVQIKSCRLICAQCVAWRP